MHVIPSKGQDIRHQLCHNSLMHIMVAHWILLYFYLSIADLNGVV